MPALENPKHERFAQGLAKGLSQIEAYREAGYKPDDGAANRLSGNVRVKARLAELQGKAAAKTETTVATLLAEGWDIIRQAKGSEDFGAASQTLERVAKIAGLWVDKSAQASISLEDLIDELGRSESGAPGHAGETAH